MKSNFKVLMVYPNIQMVNLIPTNIGLLTACLKRSGVEVQVFDATYYRTQTKSHDEVRVEMGQYKSAADLYKTTDVYEDFQTKINDFEPDLIGFSTVDCTFPLGVELMNRSNIDEKCHIIFGGIFPTFAPDLALEEKRINSICVGEGEEALVELCNRLRSNKPILDVPNLWVRDKRGEIHKNKMGTVTPLEENPYEDFTDFEPTRFLRPMHGELKKMLPVTIDRGCPYNCTFCAEPTIRALYKEQGAGNSFRIVDIDRLEDYFGHMLETYNPDYIYFNSETFFARPIKHLEKLATFYADKVKLPFSCMTRIETVTDERMELLKHMGCDRLSFGLEHGDDDFRKRIVGKPYSIDHLNHAFEILKKYNIPLTFFNIVGFPDETPELAYKTIEMNHRLVHDYDNNISTSASAFQPYYSTPLRKYCIRRGYIKETDHPGDLIKDYILDMPQFPNDRVKGIARTFALYVYLPRSMWPDIKVAELMDEDGNAAFRELRNKLQF